jgi:hypothetical protein
MASVRPARKQVATAPRVNGPVMSAGGGKLEINLWTGKPVGGQKRKVPGVGADAGSGPRPRCDPVLDSGSTRGDAVPQSFICLHFARGECARGAECTFLHRIPHAADEQRSMTYDCFGRDKFR